MSPTLQTSQFRDFKELYLLVVFNTSQLGNNINLKALFLAEMTKFLNLSMWVEENRGSVYWAGRAIGNEINFSNRELFTEGDVNIEEKSLGKWCNN